MNSEELELSLRTEFESYLKSVLAEMRQEATEFQNKIEAEFDRHRAHLDESFRSFATRFESDHNFDDAFTGSVAEHLRLARDEGARITANAIAEAEKLKEAEAPSASFDQLRDAINDISTKDSQSAILKALVQHAGDFAPRGAFFIIKNEHFVGWKVFGTDEEAAENAIREIHFPTSSNSILGTAITSLATAEGSSAEHSNNAAFLEPLQFEGSERMYAIPLVARGRGVAVLYADHGTSGADINREALETLVRVAGLTVELLAATQTAAAENRSVGAADFEDARREGDEQPQTEPKFEETVRDASFDPQPSEQFGAQSSSHFDEPAPSPFDLPTPSQFSEPIESDAGPSGFAFTDTVSFESGFPQEQERGFTPPVEDVPSPAPEFFGSDESPFDAERPAETSFETPGNDMQEPISESHTGSGDPFGQTASPGAPVVFDSGGSIESAALSSSPFDQAAEAFEPATVSSGGFDKSIEPVDMPPAQVPQARLSDRPVDLPIDVPEDERRIHNDARRFARLLVSEIKLYNEKKVTEGRQAHDLYDRLREAIDRSREMYDKRVQPPVAQKFDYFHYELVTALADGDVVRLGSGYPGSSV